MWDVRFEFLDLQVLDIRDRDAVRVQTLRENRFVRS